VALCSDMAVCKSTATFFPAWHTIEIANNAITSYSLAKIVGVRRAMEWLLTNRTVSAQEALDRIRDTNVIKTVPTSIAC
jgi:2-(1,2-epoxy-1,2-dihydrophenyl)acetyl-CoA isomerase